MTDIAAWRLYSNDDAYFVMRCHGSEHTMSKAECKDLVYHLTQVLQGAKESLGAEYAELRERHRYYMKTNRIHKGIVQSRTSDPNDLARLREALGIKDHPDLIEKPKLRRI